MKHLSRSRSLACPYARAIEYFDRYLSDLPFSDSGNGRVVRLRAALQAIGLEDNLAVDRDVIATFDSSMQTHGLEHGVVVAWSPAGGGPFPSFHGSLSVAAQNPKSCTISLEGGYEPPLGAIGKAFDAAIGHKIAESTADDLLNVIGERIELDFATDEPHLSR
jgi:hypothetical protein